MLRSMTSDASSPRSCWSAVDVRQYWERAYFVQDPRGPFIEFSDVIALQRELVLRAARSSSHAQILVGLHEESGTGHAGELATQTCDDLVRGDLALFEWFERDEHTTGIDRAAEPPPVKPTTFSTAGSSPTRVTNCCSSCRIA